MPGSAVVGGGYLPGLTLKAWVRFEGVMGTTVKGSQGVASVARASVGSYAVTLSVPMADYATAFEVQAISITSGAFIARVRRGSGDSVTVYVETFMGATPTDANGVYLAVYA